MYNVVKKLKLMFLKIQGRTRLIRTLDVCDVEACKSVSQYIPALYDPSSASETTVTVIGNACCRVNVSENYILYQLAVKFPLHCAFLYPWMD